MGVRQWMQRDKFNDPVPGTFELKSCDYGDFGSKERGRGDMHVSGVLSAPGIGPLNVEFHGKHPHGKMPIAGQILPVTVDRADPNQFRIEWDQVASESEIYEQEAEIARERASTTSVNPGSNTTEFSSTNITVTGGDLSSLPPQAQQQVQAILGNLDQVLQQGLAGGGANVVVGQPQVTINGQPIDLATAPSTQAQQQPHAHSPAPSNWDQATATVLTCHNAKVPAFATSQAPGGIVDLTIDVRLADGYVYGTKTRVAFSTEERRVRATEKGTELPVLVDPADPNRVVIDIDRIPNW